MLEIIKIRRDINWLIEQIKCLMKKSTTVPSLAATEWSENHSVLTGNPYVLNCFVYFDGIIYKSLADNNIYPPSDPNYWEDLGEGSLLLEEQSDFNATTGRAFIRNKPVNTSDFNNDGSDGVNPFITVLDIPPATFENDIPVVLSVGKTLGKYTNGQTIPSLGKTFEEVIADIALEYVNPVFTAFSVTSQSATVEVGTTISGLKTFTWNITQNSAVILTVDLYDNTAGAAILLNTPNDNTQVATVNTRLLSTDGLTQSWKAIGNNTLPIGTINSSNFVVTAQYYRFYRSTVSGVAPTNSAEVRVGTSTFSNTFPISISIGNQFAFFAYPKFRADGITQKADINNDSVKYVEGFNSSVGNTFTKTEVQVLDANSTLTWYKVYTVILPAPYPGIATYNVTIPT